MGSDKKETEKKEEVEIRKTEEKSKRINERNKE